MQVCDLSIQPSIHPDFYSFTQKGHDTQTKSIETIGVKRATVKSRITCLCSCAFAEVQRQLQWYVLISLVMKYTF